MSNGHSCGCSFDAFVGLVHIDAIVCKAAIIDEAKRLAEIERRLYQVSIAEFTRRAKPAAARLVNAIRQGKATDENSTLMLMSEFDKAFKGLPDALAPFYEKATEEAYRAGFSAIAKKAQGVYPRTQDITYPSPHRFEPVSDEWLSREKAALDIAATPGFSVVDESAIETLKKHQVFWIGTHYDKQLSDTIANATVDTMIKQGFDRAEGAIAVQEKLDKLLSTKPSAFTAETIVPHGWSGSVAQYYEGLAANTMTVSRTFGAMSGLRQLGAETYTISNPVDDRTCELCGALEGTVYEVGDGAATMDKVLGSSNPEIIKRTIRWDSLKTVQARSGVSASNMGAKASASDARSLAKNGYGLPPYHFRCRCVIDIGPSTTFGVPLDIGFEPEMPEGVPGLSFPFDATKFKVIEKNLDGAHRKFVLQDPKDPKGDEWLFKPYHKGEEYRAYGDVSAARIAQAIGHETPEVFLTKYGDEFGSIQKMYKGVQGNMRAANLAELTPKQLRVIQKEHAFDWLISNHDGHAGNLLQLKDGRLVGIDKGQLFKFFPNDSIHWNYNPNMVQGETSIYNKLLEKYSTGQLGDLKLLTLRDKELREFVKAIDALDDKTFIDLVKIYSSKRAQQRPDFDEVKFLAEALKRKKSLSKDIAGVWTKATKQRDAILGKKATPKVKGKVVTPIDKKLINEAKKSKWSGKSIMVGGDSVRDGNLLVYGIGDDVVMIEGRLTSYGDDIARTLTGEAAVQAPQPLPEVARLRHEIKANAQYLYNKFGSNPVPLQYQEETFEIVKGLLAKVRETEAKWGYGELNDYKTLIRAWWDSSTKSFNGVHLKKASTDLFPLTKLEQSAKAAGNSTLGKVYTPSVVLKGGNAILDKANGVYRSFVGVEFELKPGVKFRYIPAGKNTEYSAEKLMQIQIDKSIKNLKPEDIAEVLEELSKRGLTMPLADKEALEYQFLKSYFERQHPERNIIPDWNMSFKDKLAILRQEAEKLAKTKIDPTPSYTWGDFGKVMWKRFDIADDVLKALKKNYTLQHELYSGDALGFLKKIASKKTPGLISTEEKYRIGVVPRGMSPGSDQSTGGARMTFLRVREAASMNRGGKGSLYFEVDDAFTTHAYSYPEDMYGSIKVHSIKDMSVKADEFPEQWAKFAARTGSDETIIENGLSIGKLKQMNVTTTYERDEAIGLLKKIEAQGVKFENPIEDIVKVTSAW